jgi:hypothetical protein
MLVNAKPKHSPSIPTIELEQIEQHLRSLNPEFIVRLADQAMSLDHAARMVCEFYLHNTLGGFRCAPFGGPCLFALTPGMLVELPWGQKNAILPCARHDLAR